MIYIALRSFKNLFRTYSSYFILTFTCMTCIFISILFIQERGYRSYIDSASVYDSSQVLYFECNDPATIENIYNELKNNSSLPPFGVVTLSNETYSGVYWDVTLKKEVWHTPCGRFFTMEEMNSGANVVLLGTSYISSLPFEQMDRVWETGIIVNERPFKAVGNYYYDYPSELSSDTAYSTPFPTSITLPLNAFLDIHLVPSRFRCIFSSLLLPEQVEHINHVINAHHNIDNLSLPLTNQNQAIHDYINTVTASTFIIILALMSLIDVLIHWLKRDFPRYRVYMICGAHNIQIVVMLLINAFILVTMAYLCASCLTIFFTHFVSNELIHPLPWGLHIMIYFALLSFTLIIICIRSHKFLFSAKNLK